MFFLVGRITGSNPADIKRFISPTEKSFNRELWDKYFSQATNDIFMQYFL